MERLDVERKMEAEKQAKVEALRQQAIEEAERSPKKGGLTIPKWFWRNKS